MSDIEIHQGVFLMGVRLEGSYLHLDVYGGKDNICGSVRLMFPRERERLEHLDTLRRWERDEIPVTLVSHGKQVTLQNEQALFDGLGLTPG